VKKVDGRWWLANGWERAVYVAEGSASNFSADPGSERCARDALSEVRYSRPTPNPSNGDGDGGIPLR
jgi:hypothetical protein